VLLGEIKIYIVWLCCSLVSTSQAVLVPVDRRRSDHGGGMRRSVTLTGAYRCWSPAASPRPTPATTRHQPGQSSTLHSSRTSKSPTCSDGPVKHLNVRDLKSPLAYPPYSHGRIQTGGTGAQGARAPSKAMVGKSGRIRSVLLALPVRFQNALKHALNRTKFRICIM